MERTLLGISVLLAGDLSTFMITLSLLLDYQLENELLTPRFVIMWLLCAIEGFCLGTWAVWHFGLMRIMFAFSGFIYSAYSSRNWS